MRLTTNFTLKELRGEAASAKVKQNLQKTANGLQAFRDILGVPFRVTSGYRSPDHNDSINGAPTSDHVTGLAADVGTRLPLEEVAAKLRAFQENGGRLPVFDQLIFYPYTTGHLHFGFGQRMRRAVMVKLKEKGYRWAMGTVWTVDPRDPDRPPALSQVA